MKKTVEQQLNRNHITGGGGSWQFLIALLHFEEFTTYLHAISVGEAISFYVPFIVPMCQKTPRTEEPSHNRWQRLKLACPWFVHYDEQIMFLHVYWLFCQMLHQAFQDPSEWMHCLMESKKKKKHYSHCYGKFSTMIKQAVKPKRPVPCAGTTWPGCFIYLQHLSTCRSPHIIRKYT